MAEFRKRLSIFPFPLSETLSRAHIDGWELTMLDSSFD